MGVWLRSVSCLVLTCGASRSDRPIDSSDAIQTRTLTIISESGSLLLQMQLVLLLSCLNVRSIHICLLFVCDRNLLRVHLFCLDQLFISSFYLYYD